MGQSDTNNKFSFLFCFVLEGLPHFPILNIFSCSFGSKLLCSPYLVRCYLSLDRTEVSRLQTIQGGLQSTRIKTLLLLLSRGKSKWQNRLISIWKGRGLKRMWLFTLLHKNRKRQRQPYWGPRSKGHIDPCWFRIICRYTLLIIHL